MAPDVSKALRNVVHNRHYLLVGVRENCVVKHNNIQRPQFATPLQYELRMPGANRMIVSRGVV